KALRVRSKEREGWFWNILRPRASNPWPFCASPLALLRFALGRDGFQNHLQETDSSRARLPHSGAHRLSLVHCVRDERRAARRERAQVPAATRHAAHSTDGRFSRVDVGNRHHAGALPLGVWTRTITRVDGADRRNRNRRDRAASIWRTRATEDAAGKSQS